jgi:hypothetical protein
MDNCKVRLEKLHPDMFTVFKLNPPKLLTNKKEYHRRKNEEYRSDKKYLYNLLRELVPGTKHLSRPQLLKKTANYIQELLNPDFIPGPQEKLPRAHKKDIKDYREYRNIKMKEYRNEEISGFNLLRKCVPGTAKLTEIKLMEKTVNYIQEVLKKSPMQTLTGLGRDSVQKITLHYYPKDSARREPHSTSEAKSESQEELPEEFPDFNSVEEMKKWLGIDDNTPSPEEELLAEFNSGLLPEEKLLPAEEEVIADFNLDLLASPPEFNTTEEEVIADFNLELLGSPECTEKELLGSPDSNWTEDLRQYLEL